MTNPKVAIVTAAGRGIGAGIAKSLAAAGWKLGLLSPGETVLPLAQELGGVGVRGSVTEPKDLERLIGETQAKFGAIGGAAINMGHPPKGKRPTVNSNATGTNSATTGKTRTDAEHNEN